MRVSACMREGPGKLKHAPLRAGIMRMRVTFEATFLEQHVYAYVCMAYLTRVCVRACTSLPPERMDAERKKVRDSATTKKYTSFFVAKKDYPRRNACAYMRLHARMRENKLRVARNSS